MATGCPRTVDVRQYPDPWRFTYVSPRPAVDCNPFTAVLPSMPKDITWMRGPCTSGYVERVEWVGETRVRATGWAYLQEFGRPADAVLVTRKQAGSLVPTAAAIVTIPRGDVAAQPAPTPSSADGAWSSICLRRTILSNSGCSTPGAGSRTHRARSRDRTNQPRGRTLQGHSDVHRSNLESGVEHVRASPLASTEFMSRRSSYGR